MAAFREGKLARKNGQLQSTVVKSRTENLLDSRKKQPSRMIALLTLKCQSSPNVKVKPRYLGDVLSRGPARFAFCFLLNEDGDLSFFLV